MVKAPRAEHRGAQKRLTRPTGQVGVGVAAVDAPGVKPHLLTM
jgi:hypothetical protein